ncbi:transmembrane protein, putative, partial [Rhizoctonia solani AG-3 Rhs1AP]
MAADPPGSQTNHERSRHWITDVQVSPGNSDPNCTFSARMFADDELVCDLPAIDSTRPLQWSGLLLCNVSPTSTLTLRLCKNIGDRPRYFNFPPYVISHADEETGEATLDEARKAILNDPISARHTLDADTLAIVIDGYRLGFRTLFIVCASLTAFAFFATLFLMPHISLKREDDKALKVQAKEELERKKEAKLRGLDV